MKQSIPKMTVKEGKHSFSMSPLENYTHLQSMVEFRLGDQTVGAYLLKKNKQTPWQLVFGFECPGAHSNLSHQENNKFVERIEAGLKDFLPDETVTFHLSSFKTQEKRQERLESLVKQAPTPEPKFLVMGERYRVQELAAAGRRESKKLKIYVTCTCQEAAEEPADWIERVLTPLGNWLERLRGEGAAVEAVRLSRVLSSGFKRYGDWEGILSNKLQLPVSVLSAESLWQCLWQRLNPNLPPIEIPQLLILDEAGIREEVNSEVHSTTLLFAESVPKADRRWVYSSGKYIAPLFFMDKPLGWKDKTQQLHYIWERIARDEISDTEVFCEITPANPTMVRTTMQRIIKQSKAASDKATERSDVDVAAKINADRSEKAQASLYEGAVPFHTGIIFLIHRDSLEELEDACRYLENSFIRPAWVVREKEIAWKLWLQTLPIVQEKLLAVPFNRRLTYLNQELPGMIPLITTHSPDRDGLELIAEDGGTPVFIDLFQSEAKHLAVFGTTRSGKSVLVSGILTQALARTVPVVAIDYPKPDGTSTFTDFTQFVSPLGAYFDVGAEAVNLFERPNLAALPPDVQVQRFEDYKDFLCGCLVAMVSGANTEEILKTTIRTILYGILDRFFADDSILSRYQEAEAAGFGSEAWGQIPTLKDYLDYCTFKEIEDALNLEAGVNLTLIPKALEQIRLRLTYWIQSRIGRAISSPSTVSSDAMLMVFALRQVSQEEDAAILSLIAYAAALRRAMGSPMSIFFIDESPILFQFPDIAQLVAMLCANGAKAGIRVILTAQDPNTIAKTRVGSQIFQNLGTRLIGRIQKTATPSFKEIFHYPSEIITECERFLPNKQGVFTQWLLDNNGTITFARYYPAYVVLGVVANNPDEQAIRTEYLKRYPDKYEAILHFSQLLVRSLRSQTPLMELFNPEDS